MTLLPVLLALALQGDEKPKQFIPPPPVMVETGEKMTLAGREVPLRFPAPSPGLQMPAELLNWEGWGFLGEGAREASTPYRAAGDWTSVRERYDAAKATADAAPWRTKVVVFVRTDVLERGADGVLRQRRGALEKEQIQEALESVASFVALVTAETWGRVEIVPDVEIEQESMWRDSGAGKEPFDETFAREYFEPRINGGLYEAEDKVYRGPYHSVLYIAPDNKTPGAAEIVEVNGAPVSGIPFYGAGGMQTAGSLTLGLYKAWSAQAAHRAQALGYAGAVKAGAIPRDEWRTVASLAEPETEGLLQRLAARPAFVVPAPSTASVLLSEAFRSPNTLATLATDVDRGTVLSVSEYGNVRNGGVGLPRRPGQPLFRISQTPVLTFWAKSSTKDPIAIRVQSKGGAAWVSLGDDPAAPAEDPAVPSALAVPFARNGKWQQVSVDLRPLLGQGLSDEVEYLAIEPSPRAKLKEKGTWGNVEYLFDDFALGSQGGDARLSSLEPNVASEDPEERALVAAKAEAASDDLRKLLKDPSDFVRLNALAAYTRLKDPASEAALIEAMGSINNRIAEFAVRALAHQGTPPALAAIEKALLIGTDREKAIAAEILSQSEDPKLAGRLMRTGLFQNRSWSTRLAFIQALGRLPGSKRESF